ncbi:MAG: AmmeMemoRadiSam system protein A [Spirochaetaceae bacterium]|jgi:AmmeMemoRadiSam system protein A|nr:AmmeMemoRadiSam system protein A [Spirochaetaceae bacterium]
MKFTISSEEKDTLLAIARETILAKLENRSPAPVCAPSETGATLSQKLGAFVTLHEKNGDERTLRGCIGRLTSDGPLEKTVRGMALEAAFGDPRFPPLTKDEWPRCDIEISVLSPMKLCADVNSIEIGVHGLYLVFRGRSGVLLPQVPIEQGWNPAEYLDYICRKAGLPRKSYENTEARLYTFTAEVFSEKK